MDKIIEKLIEKAVAPVLAALARIEALLTGGAGVGTAPPPAPPVVNTAPGPAGAVLPPIEAKLPAPVAVTREAVGAALLALAKSDMAAAQRVLAVFKVATLAEVKPEQYSGVLEAIRLATTGSIAVTAESLL